MYTRWFTIAIILQVGVATHLLLLGATKSVVEQAFGAFWGAVLVSLAALPDLLYLCNWHAAKMRRIAWISTVHYLAWFGLEGRVWWVERTLPEPSLLLFCVLLLATGFSKLSALLATQDNRRSFPVWIFR